MNQTKTGRCILKGINSHLHRKLEYMKPRSVEGYHETQDGKKKRENEDTNEQAKAARKAENHLMYSRHNLKRSKET